MDTDRLTDWTSFDAGAAGALLFATPSTRAVAVEQS